MKKNTYTVRAMLNLAQRSFGWLSLRLFVMVCVCGVYMQIGPLMQSFSSTTYLMTFKALLRPILGSGLEEYLANVSGQKNKGCAVTVSWSPCQINLRCIFFSCFSANRSLCDTDI